MIKEIRFSEEFDRAFKRLKKRYRSLPDDVKADMQNVSDNFLDQVIKDVGEGKFNSVSIDTPEA